MRHHTIALFASCLLMGPVTSSGQGHTPLQFDGDIALWTVAVKPDKTADFEAVMQKLRNALQMSSRAERRQQAAGWRIVRLPQPLPDGNIAYVHVVHPIVRGADYTVMQTLYDELPEERQSLYELYRGAFAKNLSLAAGSIVVDMSVPAAPSHADRSNSVAPAPQSPIDPIPQPGVAR
jgi:hypothetical protein